MLIKVCYFSIFGVVFHSFGELFFFHFLAINKVIFFFQPLLSVLRKMQSLHAAIDSHSVICCLFNFDLALQLNAIAVFGLVGFVSFQFQNNESSRSISIDDNNDDTTERRRAKSDHISREVEMLLVGANHFSV